MLEYLGSCLILGSLAGLAWHWKEEIKRLLTHRAATKRQVICSCGFNHNYKVSPGQPVICLKCATVLFKPGEIEHYNDYDR